MPQNQIYRKELRKYYYLNSVKDSQLLNFYISLKNVALKPGPRRSRSLSFFIKSDCYYRNTKNFIVLGTPTTFRKLRAVLQAYDDFCARFRHFKRVGSSNNTPGVSACKLVAFRRQDGWKQSKASDPAAEELRTQPAKLSLFVEKNNDVSSRTFIHYQNIQVIFKANMVEQCNYCQKIGHAIGDCGKKNWKSKYVSFVEGRYTEKITAGPTWLEKTVLNAGILKR